MSSQGPPPNNGRHGLHPGWLIGAAAALAIVVGVGVLLFLLLRDSGPAVGPGRTAQVTGTVKLADGRPLPAGWVAFHGADASQTALAPVDGGKFVARLVPTGEDIKVTIDVAGIETACQSLDLRLLEAQTRSALMKKAGKADSVLDKRIDEMKDRRKQLDEQKRALQGISIARRYTQRQTTPLTFLIEEGVQTLDIVVKP